MLAFAFDLKGMMKLLSPYIPAPSAYDKFYIYLYICCHLREKLCRLRDHISISPAGNMRPKNQVLSLPRLAYLFSQLYVNQFILSLILKTEAKS